MPPNKYSITNKQGGTRWTGLTFHLVPFFLTMTNSKPKAAARLWGRVLPNVYNTVRPAAVKGFLMGNQQYGSGKALKSCLQ